MIMKWTLAQLELNVAKMKQQLEDILTLFCELFEAEREICSTT